MMPDAAQPTNATAAGSTPTLNPMAVSVSAAAKLLGVSEEALRRHINDGAPAGPGDVMNLVHYAAWLNAEMNRSGHGD